MKKPAEIRRTSIATHRQGHRAASSHVVANGSVSHRGTAEPVVALSRAVPVEEDEALDLAVLESAAPVDDEPSKDRRPSARSRTAESSKKLRRIRTPPPGASWLAYRKSPWRRGYVTLAGHGKHWSGYLVGADGEVLRSARAPLERVFASWRTGKRVEIDDRLIGLIADLSDEFGGRTIRVVSGYRETSYAPDSKHKVGEAFDFSIPGVPNELIRDFLRSLPDVGVGYYPNSTHVHLDVRDKPTYWVDYSRPGQSPRYSYDRRVAGLDPAEKSLADAMDRLVRTLRRAEQAESDTEALLESMMSAF